MPSTPRTPECQLYTKSDFQLNPPIPISQLPLSAQERRILISRALGLSNKETAATVGLSPKTIEVYLWEIYNRLGCHSLPEVVIRCGWVSIPGVTRERIVKTLPHLEIPQPIDPTLLLDPPELDKPPQPVLC